MISYSGERTGVFIDGANLYSSARGLGFDIDYRKLLDLFRQNGRMVRAFYYTALIDDQEYSPLRPLVDWLDYNGYTVVTKPTKEFTDGFGRRKIKGNMDIELAIDMMEMAQHLDHVVLFSGDGDFRRLVEAVQRRGVRVTVVSTTRTTPAMVADELRRQADVFIELQDLAPRMQRPPREDHGYNRPEGGYNRPEQNPRLDQASRYDQAPRYDGPTRQEGPSYRAEFQARNETGPRQEPVRPEPTRPEQGRSEQGRPEPVRYETIRPDTVRSAPLPRTPNEGGENGEDNG